MLTLSLPVYENRNLKVDDALITDDNGNNRFQLFAAWNLENYYSYVTDVTATTYDLSSEASFPFSDYNGSWTAASLSADGLWNDIDNTKAFGI